MDLPACISAANTSPGRFYGAASVAVCPPKPIVSLAVSIVRPCPCLVVALLGVKECCLGEVRIVDGSVILSARVLCVVLLCCSFLLCRCLWLWLSIYGVRESSLACVCMYVKYVVTAVFVCT